MVTSNSRFIRILQLFLIFYLSIAVLYTTTLLFVSIYYSVLAKVLPRPTSPQSLWPLLSFFLPGHTLAKEQNRFGALQINMTDPFSLHSGGYRMGWVSSAISLEHNLGGSGPVFMDEDIFLSKAFSGSMRPSKILPYFYRASGQFDHEDITIATLITSNRFQVFKRLVQRYKGAFPLANDVYNLTPCSVYAVTGPISVTIHVRNTTAQDLQDLLHSLHALYTSSESMATFVDVHLVIDSFDRQFNTWRNIARFFARTEFVLMLDIDFAICTDFRSSIRKSQHIKEQLREGYSAFVVPAFEYVKFNEGVDLANFPKDKRVSSFLVA
jgi:Glycosyl-transferase for dystroglycan